jgi:hypothetical protein
MEETKSPDARSAEPSQRTLQASAHFSQLESKRVALSIKNFNPSKPQPIDSPRSLKAMELLYIRQEQLAYKDAKAFKNTAVDVADLERLLKKDKIGVECLVDQVKRKRKELTKKELEQAAAEQKHREEQAAMARKLKIQSERAERIKREVEAKTAQEIERKFEERYHKIKAGEGESPYYDQYNNLTYVPKPKEYFKVNAMTQSIKQRMDLSKRKVDLIKNKQLHDMGNMVDYEINIQSIKKRNDHLHQQKLKTLKSMENFKKQRFEKNKEILEEHEKRHKLQKEMEKMIKMENKKRLMMINEREANIKAQKIAEHEHRVKIMKQSDMDYEQNRKYMVKQLLGDFKELKNNQVTPEEIDQKYSYLRDEETFQKVMRDLNYRRQLSSTAITKKLTRSKRPVSRHSWRHVCLDAAHQSILCHQQRGAKLDLQYATR